MSYIGNDNITQGFIPAIDFFSGNGSTVAFTLSRPVASVAQVQANISNVPQNPSSAFSVSGNTITFTSAPPSGSNNIYVYYTSPITQVIAPSQGTVGTSQLQNGLVVNFADGSAAAPSITNDGDTNTGIFFPAADTIGFAEGGAEIARFDSSGNFGINTSSPLAKLNISGGTTIASLTDWNSKANTVFTTANPAVRLGVGYDASDIPLIQGFDSTNAARNIAVNPYGGNLLVGTTTLPSTSGIGIGFMPGYSSSGVSMVCRTGTAASNDNIFFYTPSGLAGYIRTNGTTTTYVSVSDERLKENIANSDSATEKVQQIQVRKFDWKSGDGHVDYGFIAQELNLVAPQAVAEGTEENDVWAVDSSMLVPLLTKAIQEQQAIITTLTDRITALEGAK